MSSVKRHPELLEDRSVADRLERLRVRSSVCSYCGVGCPYTVETGSRGRDDVHPLSDLGLCVKGKTSLMTGSDTERVTLLARRDIADDRIRAPMIRGQDGKMKEVSWDEALDRAAWLFLHAREWVGPDAVAIYGNGQKTVEAIGMASLYKLVFNLPTIGANSEHCLTSAGDVPAHFLGISPADLADSFIGLGILDAGSDVEVIDAIRCADPDGPFASSVLDDDELYAGTLAERVDRVVASIIAPVLANDGGRLDILGIDEHLGELRIRFVGSCANCPYSLLSMEQIVKPTLLAIPGIQRVTHRAKARDRELEDARNKSGKPPAAVTH